jgi:hypothetical protein
MAAADSHGYFRTNRDPRITRPLLSDPSLVRRAERSNTSLPAQRNEAKLLLFPQVLDFIFANNTPIKRQNKL